jgi:hypothetical protein
LKDAILRMIVERCDGRPLSRQDATLAAFEIKQSALLEAVELAHQDRSTPVRADVLGSRERMRQAEGQCTICP